LHAGLGIFGAYRFDCAALSNGLSEEFGACVGKGPPSHICDYSVGIISDAGGKPALVRTGRYQGLDSSGRARWLLTDTLAYPRTSDERVLIYATCLLNGQPDPSVFALIDKPEEQAKRAAGWAYRVDLASGKFVKLSPASVKCYQPGGDND